MKSLEQLRAGKLTGSRRLNLSCHLKEFPREIFELADTLEILDLSHNQLSELPADFPRLHQLKILFCSDNLFASLPAVLGQCPQLTMIGFRANQISLVPASSLPPDLRWLVLTDNRITELPSAIGNCTSLQKLMLAGNQLKSLPPSISNCTNLELLRISSNKFSAFPDALFDLPNLSWLAFAGNPLSNLSDSVSTIREINWHDLALRKMLGEGASGVIHQAEWLNNSSSMSVAVKVFKGQLTSDGLPQHEMAACMRASEAPNLISVMGKIVNHPNHAQGLVMSLIDPDFSNLAGPPSLDSCTRDCYSPEQTFTQAKLLQIALSIAAAAQHLHANGVMHGDLYAHNIMVRDDGHSLLGDFGAATLYLSTQDDFSLKLQRIEVLAFGRLLAELLSRCETLPHSNADLRALQQLQVRCADVCPAQRPLFEEIVTILSQLAANI
ncbi:MAG: hypothetical protein RLZZ144_1027 [Pseudomonadota bacterium]|jgi:hypothetical protein